MLALELEGFEIDYCPECQGIWLDSGELEILLGRTLPNGLLVTPGTKQNSRRRCPVCGKRMILTSIGPQNRAVLDACRFDHGLWFDRGEIQLVAETLDKPIREAVVKKLDAIFALAK